MADPTSEQTAALDVARRLAEHDIPVFIAHPARKDGRWNPTGGSGGCGYWIPRNWETTKPDPRYLEAWKPGMALCAVMGQGLDLVDLDPRSGGSAASLDGAMPTVHGVAATPSGGWHGFVKTLGVRSRDKVLPGIDVKAGDERGKGRGFAFIAPTVRGSKVDGEIRPYVWSREPDLEALKAAADDRSGERLAAMVRAAHGGRGASHGPFTNPDPFKTSPLDDVAGTIADNTRHNAVHKLASALRGRGGWRVEDALAYMRAVVWPLLDHQSPGTDGAPYTEAEFEGDIRAVFDQYPDGPDDDSSPRAGDGARPELRILSPATMAEWIRVQLGSGPLAGMFSRGNDIVFTPREGEDGYIEPRNSGDHDGPAQIRVLTPGMITARIQWTYRCYRRIKSGKNWYEESALFPAAASTVAVNAADMIPGLRILHGVTHTPLVRADGSILTAAGYDLDTKLLHLPELGLAVSAVPDRPSGGDVKQAVTLLDEMVAGFPFVSEHHRANYLGYLLTPLLRELTPPPYKLCAVTAPQPGSGKTLLATTMRIIHGGVFRAEMPEDEAELRKQVTAILDQTTGPVIHIDNVTGVLRSSTLAGLLTSNRWDDRRLGATEMVSRANDRTWMITGNNVAIGGDLPRRTIPVVIDPGIPHPERRTGFAIADLEGWVRDHRGELLWALLTLVRAWVIAGLPVGAEAGSDGYARWVRTIRGILTNAGVAGMFDDADTRLDVGTDDDEWGEFLEAVYAVFGDQPWTVKELLAKFSGFPSPLSVDVLPSQLADKIDKVTGSVKPIGRSLGIWLRNREGRWSGDHTVRKAWTDRVGAACWVLEAHQGKDGAT